MAGIYLHIPYCKKACHYCNFHFSTTLHSKPAMVEALLRELDLQKDYLDGAPLDSIYFGGGTPSILDTKDLERIFEKIYRDHQVNTGAEITLEANPDDLTPEKLHELRHATPVNRLSIGIQSFFEEHLQWMNHAHNAREARACLDQALALGFDDLSIDLIYGLPSLMDEQWAENVRIALAYKIPHLSCYCLTVEEGTALHNFVRKGKAEPVDEEKASRQFQYLLDQMEAAGYVHYEISNFALPGRHARHNSSYWQGAHYLGVGPAAHAFNGVSRQWNIANNALYIKSLEAGVVPFEMEDLSPEKQYNEYVMTGLRTIWGCDLQHIRKIGTDYVTYFEKLVQTHLAEGTVVQNGSVFTLSRKGKFMADGIASDLFFLS